MSKPVAARLDTAFKEEGSWWDPASPTSQFRGTLSCVHGELFLEARDNALCCAAKLPMLALHRQI